jgi:hypothetical protein
MAGFVVDFSGATSGRLLTLYWPDATPLSRRLLKKANRRANGSLPERRRGLSFILLVA